jgi:hypothetical protein
MEGYNTVSFMSNPRKLGSLHLNINVRENRRDKELTKRKTKHRIKQNTRTLSFYK